MKPEQIIDPIDKALADNNQVLAELFSSDPDFIYQALARSVAEGRRTEEQAAEEYAAFLESTVAELSE